MTTWLHDVLSTDTAAFALLHRPNTNPEAVDLLAGEVLPVQRLADLPVPVDHNGDGPTLDLLALVPYRQIAERGFDCIDDGTPLQALKVHRHSSLSITDVLDAVPKSPTPLHDVDFDVTDDEYAESVRKIVTDEIGTGEGANFVLKRSLLASIEQYADDPRRHALAVFGRLLAAETGAHWTFLVHTGTRTLIGASPERHVTLRKGIVTMNPISGTFRYPPGGLDMPALRDFLADAKEIDELYMVLDEELKMMGRVCRDGGRVIGPQMRPMARLAHTEYFIEGESLLDVRQILHETMFAPTVTGSPLESACRAIARHERNGRGYYAGALALIGRDETGNQEMDSAIGIRTAEIDAEGRVRIDVGATLVRHSDPLSEAAETQAKAAALLAAFAGSGGRSTSTATHRASQLWEDPEVRQLLANRNRRLAGFWLRPQHDRSQVTPMLRAKRVLVIDCEDHFTAMLGHQLTALGLDVTIRRFDTDHSFENHDLIVMGPGPGDPTVVTDPKIATMRSTIMNALDAGHPMLAVCLGHQVLAGVLGLEVRRLAVPNQGAQHEIDVLERREHCGFYNTFAAYAPADQVSTALGGVLSLDRDPATGVVHAIHGERFRSLQFHAESVLTEHGVDLIGQLCTALLAMSTTDQPTELVPLGSGGTIRYEEEHR